MCGVQQACGGLCSKEEDDNDDGNGACRWHFFGGVQLLQPWRQGAGSCSRCLQQKVEDELQLMTLASKLAHRFSSAETLFFQGPPAALF